MSAARRQSGDPATMAAPHIFTIDAGRPFLEDLADGVLTACEAGPFGLADARIFVPTRRAARALGEVFMQRAARQPIKQADGGEDRAIRAMLLPQIDALGDVDDDESLVMGGVHEQDEALPPAVSPMERKLMLAHLVVARLAASGAKRSQSDMWPAAVRAAGELGKLLDSFYTEEIPFSRLARAAPEKFAAHWAQSLDFLKIVTEAWPAYLSETGQMDPAARRAALISAKAEAWTAAPPAFPVFVAGTTGSAPSVARLMAAIAAAPRGAVILPGLDRALAREPAWSHIEDPHPQAGMKILLETFKTDPAQIPLWPQNNEPGRHCAGRSQAARRALVSLALRPAESTDDWRALVADLSVDDQHLEGATRGLYRIDADTEEQEAAIIALLFRETLETPEKTALLITPDRDLAERVSLKMRRWDVRVDDSGGSPLHNTRCGVFIRLVMTWIADPCDPIALMALARHPLAGFGLAPSDQVLAVNALDEGLRDQRPICMPGEHPGDALARKLAAARSGNISEDAAPIVDFICAQIFLIEGVASFEDRLTHALALCEAVAARAAEAGPARLWRGDDGDAAARFFASLLAQPLAAATAAASFPDLMTTLMSGVTVRRRAGEHPRLMILGPLEARLQTADRIILGGLNEGVWPADAGADPFLSRPMRTAIGLPSLERRTGLAAHDFAQHAAQNNEHGEVFLTRARRAGDAPSKPSRWLLRLDNLLAGADAFKFVDRSPAYRALARSLDAPARFAPADAPRPSPPLSARPKGFYVTEIGRLLRDPYGVYARRVLGLRKLDAIAAPFGPAHLGQMLHAVFEDYARQNPSQMSAAPRADLWRLFAERRAVFAMPAPDEAFFRQTIDEAFSWFASFHAERLMKGAPTVLEETGVLALPVNGHEVEIRARVDRIDQEDNGAIAVYDYKLRKLPTLKQIDQDFSPQLPLTALIALGGGFEGLSPVEGAAFYYLRMIDRAEAQKDVGLKGDDAAAAIAEARAGFVNLMTHYLDEGAPYLSQPRPEFTTDWGDYDQLARRKEWAARERAS